MSIPGGLRARVSTVHIHDLPTPALLVDAAALEHNVKTMAAARPGVALRPHVKAFKSTDLARYIRDTGGHRGFCAATAREIEGLAAAGLGDDLLLANEVLAGPAARLGAVVRAGKARITMAVDSHATIDAAATNGLREVLIDVNVGLPRCGCDPADAGWLADAAWDRGLTVRGVMGYEGHLVAMTDRVRQAELVEQAMAALSRAHDDVGGEIISAGGTGTYDVNLVATEIQAGSYVLMDSHYARLGLPFQQALHLLTTVISVNTKGWYVADGGLKALGMDHGNPVAEHGEVWFCSDEHTTIRANGVDLPKVGDRVRLVPAHVDPTVAKHPTLHLVDGQQVVESWPVDLRDW
jgi:D-serine deaminase-like pyridoxal phosphate-dependent protein